MKIQSGKAVIILALTISIVMPFSVSAAQSAGIKPSSIFYFLDITSERIGLFFIFNPEKKARKALEYADERLAEVEAEAEDKDIEAVKTAITNYKSSVAFAVEKSRDLKEKEKAEALLATITDSTSKHQEVLADVLAKVPDEAKEAIIKAIEASRKGHEEALQKIAELKGEVERLKQEVVELKVKDEEKGRVIEELSKQKTESPVTQQKISSPQSPVTPTQKPEITQSQTSPKIETPKTISIVTLPNGAVVEMDVNGNVLRYIKEALKSITTQSQITPVALSPTSPPTQIETLEITSVSVTPDVTSTKIEWQTNKPTESKVFISGVNLSSKIFTSVSGLSTRHYVTITGLSEKTDYSYEIETIAGGATVAKRQGRFETLQSLPTPVDVLIEGNSATPIEFSVFKPNSGGQPLSVRKLVLVQKGTIEDMDLEFVSYLEGSSYEKATFSNGKIYITYKPNHGNRILLNPKIKSSGLGKTFSVVIENIEVELKEKEILGVITGLNKTAGRIVYPENFIIISPGEGTAKLTEYCQSKFQIWNPTPYWFNDNACMISN